MTSPGATRDSPEVTVVIPTRNRWGLLRRTLAGALAQDSVDLEVVLVDDGSTDETRTLGECDQRRLRVIRLPERRGSAHARNAGIAAARGRWVAFLDDDDLWAPLKLRLQLDAAEAAGADFVYAGAIVVDPSARVIREGLPIPDPTTLLPDMLRRYVMPGGCSNPIVHTALLERTGGFDERFYGLYDWDMWIRLASAGRAAACPQTLVAYVEHSANMSLEAYDVLPEYEYLMVKHRALRESLGVEADRSAFLGWVIGERRRAGRRFSAARLFAERAIAERDPADFARAAAVLLGERATALARAVVLRSQHRDPGEGPAWLSAYRDVPA